MTDTTKKMIEIISNAENINRLPLLEDLKKELDAREFLYMFFCDFPDKDFEIETWQEITIKDGTKIILKSLPNNKCFDSKCHRLFYYIEKIDTYICLDCGLKQKLHEYESDGFIKNILLPADWNKHGIDIYLKRRVEREKAIKDGEYLIYDKSVQAYLLYKGCNNCRNMKQDKCKYGKDNLKYEVCEYWEYRI